MLQWKEETTVPKFTRTHALSALQLVSWITPTLETSYSVEAPLMAGVGLFTLVNICGTTQILDPTAVSCLVGTYLNSVLVGLCFRLKFLH